MERTLIEGALVLERGRALASSILVEGDVIAALLAPHEVAEAQKIDATGCLVIPGLIKRLGEANAPSRLLADGL
jgi:dihydroorotase-like cyclic amidohydrolase